MAILNFMKQFAEDVETGRKQQTIRAERKQPVRVGETLHLYTCLRTKSVRLLGRRLCTETKQIVIENHGDIFLDGEPLMMAERKALAHADGFKGPLAAVEMVNFFRQTHGLPFYGSLIKWRW